METELGRIVDALPGLVWTALPDGQADFTNRRWCEYTGLSAEEAAGWGWLAAVHPEDKERLIGAWQAILDSIALNVCFRQSAVQESFFIYSKNMIGCNEPEHPHGVFCDAEDGLSQRIGKVLWHMNTCFR